MQTPLSRRDLDDLERVWTRVGAPIRRHLRPGLDHAAIAALSTTIGLKIPFELRLWWGWHDGIEPQGWWPSAESDIGVGLPYLSLAEGIELYRQSRPGLEKDVGIDRAESYWSAAWLPISRWAHGSLLVAACDVAADTVSPVRVIRFEDLEPDPAPLTLSLGEAVRKWIGAIEIGARYYDASRGHWFQEPSRMGLDPSLAPFG